MTQRHIDFESMYKECKDYPARTWGDYERGYKDACANKAMEILNRKIYKKLSDVEIQKAPWLFRREGDKITFSDIISSKDFFTIVDVYIIREVEDRLTNWLHSLYPKHDVKVIFREDTVAFSITYTHSEELK